jgi:hypothetical protein
VNGIQYWVQKHLETRERTRFDVSRLESHGNLSDALRLFVPLSDSVSHCTRLRCFKLVIWILSLVMRHTSLVLAFLEVGTPSWIEGQGTAAGIHAFMSYDFLSPSRTYLPLLFI